MVGAIILLPWWLGVLLSVVLPRWGVHFARYERLGYAHFALNNVSVERRRTLVSISRIEADTPVLWLVRRIAGKTPIVTATDWAMVVSARKSGDPASVPTPDAGWMRLRGQLLRVADRLETWLPEAHVGSGVVRWPRQELRFRSATWKGRTLDFQGFGYRALVSDGTLDFPRGDSLIRGALHGATSDDIKATLHSDGAAISGDLAWLGQAAKLSARFDARGWMPLDAELEGGEWSVPAQKLKLGSLYTQVRGSAHLILRGGQLTTDFSASGDPLTGKKAPPLDVKIHGAGTGDAFAIDALRVQAPGISAQLSDTVTFDRRGQIQPGNSHFTVHADLAQQPWFEARGIIDSAITLTPGATMRDVPTATFRAALSGLVWRKRELPRADVNGKLVWPRVELTEAKIALTDTEAITAKGAWDFAAKQINDAVLTGHVTRAAVAAWVPAALTFESIELYAAANGPTDALVHTGTLRMKELHVRDSKPFEGLVSWNGVGLRVENFSIATSAEDMSFKAEGAVDSDRLQLREFVVTHGSDETLRLQAPAEVAWRPLHVDRLTLRGKAGEVNAAIDWAETGHIDLAVRGLASSVLNDFVPLRGPAWRVEDLTIAGTWAKGPMKFTTNARVMLDMGQQRQAEVTLVARGDEKGLKIETVRATEAGGAIVTASGELPLTLKADGGLQAQFDVKAPLKFDMDSVANEAFWARLAELTGVQLVEPQLTSHLHGTAEHPEGEVRLKATRVTVDPKRFTRPLPRIESLDAILSGDREGIILKNFSVLVDGQQAQLDGRVPVAEGQWSDLWQKPLDALRRGSGLHLKIPGADVASLAHLLPKSIAPQGLVELDVTVKDAASAAGFVRVRGAATRPIGSLGTVQEINAEFRFDGRKAEVASATALLGGQTVTLSGNVELPAQGEPKLNLGLKGENLPFVRQAGLLMRGDLDLKLVSTEAAVGATRAPAPRITGTVKLRDSLFLTDIRALMRGGAKTKARRPPYFAVEVQPFANWRLDVNVEGDRFMRMRTPVFDGMASAHFNLRGTLSEPYATGAAVIDQGLVRLPFATFDVQEGRVTLSREQPYEPQISVVASVRRYDYNLRMEITGTATAPSVIFSSNPPLESGQVLLLVMAGEAPHDEITYTDRQRVARVGAFLGQTLLSSFSGDSDAADRLTLASGERVSEQGRETYSFEYRLNDRWSLTGEYDEYDDYNAGFKWRVYSKGGQVRIERRQIDDDSEK